MKTSGSNTFFSPSLLFSLTVILTIFCKPSVFASARSENSFSRQKKIESQGVLETPFLRDQALRENQIPELPTDQAKEILSLETDLQGILRLDNPYRDPRIRRTRNTFALSFRPFQPSGFAEVEASQRFDFSEFGEMILPTLEYSVLSRRSLDSTNFDYGLKGSAGYFARTKRLSLRANLEDSDVTFGILVAEIGPMIQIRPTSWGIWHWNTMAVYGVAHHHQNSSSAFARFAINQTFWGMNAGPGIQISQDWYLEASYKYAQSVGTSRGNSLLRIPESSYSVGISRQW